VASRRRRSTTTAAIGNTSTDSAPAPTRAAAFSALYQIHRPRPANPVPLGSTWLADPQPRRLSVQVPLGPAQAGNPRSFMGATVPMWDQPGSRESAIGGTTNVLDWRALQRLIAGIDTFLRKEALLVEDVEQGEAWQHEDRRQPDRDQHGRQGAGG
jgi:hypothetical protein